MQICSSKFIYPKFIFLISIPPNIYMLIQHKKVSTKGLFFAGRDGDILAELTYTMPSENKMIIDHTEVDDSLRGKGVGLQLVHTAVEYARNHNIKILPLCPFAKSVFDKKVEFGDVLA
jgi:uncharacterized protein